MINSEITNLAWDKVDHLMPAIIQDVNTGQVLMLGYMDQEALQQTLATKRVTFFSRSKNRLWVKGETSGNFLELVEIVTDCDQDSLLIRANPSGPCCHLQTKSCFSAAIVPQNDFLKQLETVIEQRYSDPTLQSYTSQLFAAGTQRIAQKVGEEGVEVALAAVCEAKEKLVAEAADLIFHLLVLLRQCDSGMGQVMAELQRRGNGQTPAISV